MVAHSGLTTRLIGEEELALKYHCIIQEIGPMVEEFLPHGMLIFFGMSAPDELREVAVVHDGTNLYGKLAAGDVLRFTPPQEQGRTTEQASQPMTFRITAVGEMADENLAQLGHIVIHFDAATTPNLPGAVSVEPLLERLPLIGTTFEIVGEQQSINSGEQQSINSGLENNTL